MIPGLCEGREGATPDWVLVATVYGYATRPNTCGRQGVHCFKAIVHSTALSLFLPLWIDAFKLTCHMGRPVTAR